MKTIGGPARLQASGWSITERPMKLKANIWTLPIVASLGFMLGVAVIYVHANRSMRAIEAIGNADAPYMDFVNDFSGNFEYFKTTIDGAVADEDKARLRLAGKLIDQSHEMLERASHIPGHQADVAQLTADFDAYASPAMESAQRFLKLKEGSPFEVVPRMRQAQKRLDAEVGTLKQSAHTSFDAGLERAKSGVASSLQLSLLMAVVVVSGLIACSRWLIGKIWRQLGGEPEYASTVMRSMAQGDLSQRIDLQDAQSHSLLGAVQAMSTGLANIVSHVRSGADSVNVAARQIAAGNQDLSERTEQQASSLSQTSHNMQALTATVRRSAEAAQQSSELAESAAKVAQKGGQAVAQVVSTMEDINRSSEKINDIIGVIDGIAFQTNILALNAAVEAARAGEQGRGFAVVASEVRMLARRSADAAKEIKTLISASVDKVRSGTNQVQSAGETMNDILSSVQRVTDIIGEITHAAVEQRSNIEQINTSISQLEHMTSQNSAAVRQAAAAALALEKEASSLQDTMVTFKLQDVSEPTSRFES